MASPLTSPPLAKAVLYYFPKSIWSQIPLLTLHEKGYGEEEIDLKIVDLSKGLNYEPAYARINPSGTVPCLVVPLEKTLAPGIENKYKALTDSTAIAEFLDKSRSTTSKTHTVSSAPSPMLSPATMASANTSSTIISLLHSSDLEVIKLVTSARNIDELRKKANGLPGATVKIRTETLQHNLETQGANVNVRVKEMWTARLAKYKPIYDVFAAAPKEENELTPEQKTARDEWFSQSDALWEGEVKRLLATLEKEIIGPYALGDQLSLADLHLAAYITRLVTLSGGDGSKSGIDSIAKHASSSAAGGHVTIGPKVRGYWEAIIERESWKKIYGNGIF
ncbi:hypothetical protein SISNIDRAFT_483421 [Sistotremastrum niveocremeum HHB9708]|uniref:GST N-terminal domain-containing protein n=2 Tax=Sistotremastraceae TaxID=3402574 RepID=A0A164XIJ0_9AGAM|nr:hypothetical protein SISNIDRAFT_483421 [Sistotremastrum niveocremeum HHB9708]KZT37379.1 hypothetical protein SISSUDRAFT_1062840 [Sistotremastrum suecicum HHB10207 ss-3]